jgi:glutaredoxin
VSTVTVYVREGCHLCADALAALERLRAEAPFALEVVDIEADDDLHRRLLERIPVIEVDGAWAGDFFLDEAAVRARLRSTDG